MEEPRPWEDRHARAAEAVALVRPGDRVFVGSVRHGADARGGARGPRRAAQRRDLIHFLIDRVDVGDPPETAYRHRVFYAGRDVVALSEGGRVDYVPLALPDVPRLFRAGQLPLDVALIQVAPPDADGTCSLGVSVDGTRAAALAARTGVAEVNPAMPRTRGDSAIPAARIARFVAVDTPVTEYVHEPADGVAEQIARYVARLVADGSTLQVGLGRVPNRMLAQLTNRHGLGIHSDVITEPVADLVGAGVAPARSSAAGRWAPGACTTCSTATSASRCTRSSTSATGGHRRTRADGLHHAGLQRRPDRAGVQERLDGRLYGGISTGPAFHRGAIASPGGMAIVCLASRTPAGEPAIRADLEPDAAVAISRAEVHWVITEYGTAYLFGRTLAERAVALAEIAHPDDREALLAAAIARGLAGPPPAPAQPHRLPRGARPAAARPARGAPAPNAHHRRAAGAGALLPPLGGGRPHALLPAARLAQRQGAQQLCSADFDQEMAFAAVVGPHERERIVAASSYFLNRPRVSPTSASSSTPSGGAWAWRRSSRSAWRSTPAPAASAGSAPTSWRLERGDARGVPARAGRARGPPEPRVVRDTPDLRVMGDPCPGPRSSSCPCSPSSSPARRPPPPRRPSPA